MEIVIGDADTEPVALRLKTLARHMVCLGSSGSGKTVACKVICEEFVRKGIPVIAVDPQGDIASLAKAAAPDEVESHGLPPEMVTEYDDMAQVVIWTPGSTAGIPLSVNPLKFDVAGGRAERRLRSLSLMAGSLLGLLGYDSESDDGRYASALLNIVFEHAHSTGTQFRNFDELADLLNDMPPKVARRAGKIVPKAKIEAVARELRMLGVGANRLLFQMGVPLDIDTLLGAKEEDRTRVSVIYLNSLGSQEEKDFFLCQLVHKLYQWMLSHPSKDVQALFYIDEIAPFLPPVRKPAAKDILKLLFKQARKYGISCLIATQNPGDVDYSALAQFSTWNLGRLLTRQDIKKVGGVIKSISPGESDAICGNLPKLQAGNFMLLSPDQFKSVVDYRVRWLLTEHTTFDEDLIAEFTPDELRQMLQPPEAEQPEEAEEAEEEEEPEEQEAAPKPPPSETPPEATGVETEMQGEDEDDEEPAVDEDEAELTVAAAPSDTDSLLDFLQQKRTCLKAKEIANELTLSSAKATGLLRRLVREKKVRQQKIGRSTVYWAAAHSLLPQYGLAQPVNVAKLEALEHAAHKAADGLCRGGLFGRKEDVVATEFWYLPLWRIRFKGEMVTGFIFRSRVTKEDCLYVDAVTTKLCVVSRDGGLDFIDSTDQNPLKIEDPDDVCTFEEVMPGELELQTRKLRNIKPPSTVRRSLLRKFRIEILRIDPVFLPYWEFTIEKKSDNSQRKVMIDGVLGEEMRV